MKNYTKWVSHFFGIFFWFKNSQNTIEIRKKVNRRLRNHWKSSDAKRVLFCAIEPSNKLCTTPSCEPRSSPSVTSAEKIRRLRTTTQAPLVQALVSDSQIAPPASAISKSCCKPALTMPSMSSPTEIFVRKTSCSSRTTQEDPGQESNQSRIGTYFGFGKAPIVVVKRGGLIFNPLLFCISLK